jgi:hypothetical protein
MKGVAGSTSRTTRRNASKRAASARIPSLAIVSHRARRRSGYMSGDSPRLRAFHNLPRRVQNVCSHC